MRRGSGMHLIAPRPGLIAVCQSSLLQGQYPNGIILCHNTGMSMALTKNTEKRTPVLSERCAPAVRPNSLMIMGVLVTFTLTVRAA